MASVTFFVPGKLSNPLNGAHGHWSAEAAYRKRWRAATKACALSVEGRIDLAALGHATEPKAILLTAHTWNTMDRDGLGAALKPVVDGLVDAGIIHDDGPTKGGGHVLTYRQRVDRRNRGVLITVEPR